MMSNPARQKRSAKAASLKDDGSRKRGKTDDEVSPCQRGQTFIEALMGAQKKSLRDSPDICYLEDIPMIRSGHKKTIVLTQEVELFWEACILHSALKRVCAVGSPGAGKSTTMLYLIRLLLEAGKKVVYLNKTGERDSNYYVWEENEDGEYTTAVYPEATPVKGVINAANGDKVGDTYYLCDPGLTLVSCNPSTDLKASVIINASGDDRHWGGREFTKEKEDPAEQHGIKLVFPMPKKQQLVNACHLFSNSFTTKQVEERHRIFGSVPRHVFQDDDDCAQQHKQQVTDLALMSSDMTRRIVNNTAELNNNSLDCPRSSIMGITSDPSDFAEQKAIYISDHVAEMVARKHMKDVWNEVSAADNSPNRGLLFEAFLRSLLKGKTQKFTMRNACGKKSANYGPYNTLSQVQLGGCVEIERTDDMIGSCKKGRNRVIYYSYNEAEKLVDFMYKVGKVYYAIQVTIREDHDCDENMLEEFLIKLDLKEDEELNLVYTVPDGVFKRFVTRPVTAGVPNLPGDVYILHAEIKRPSD